MVRGTNTTIHIVGEARSGTTFATVLTVALLRAACSHGGACARIDPGLALNRPVTAVYSKNATSVTITAAHKHELAFGQACDGDSRVADRGSAGASLIFNCDVPTNAALAACVSPAMASCARGAAARRNALGAPATHKYLLLMRDPRDLAISAAIFRKVPRKDMDAAVRRNAPVAVGWQALRHLWHRRVLVEPTQTLVVWFDALVLRPHHEAGRILHFLDPGFSRFDEDTKGAIVQEALSKASAGSMRQIPDLARGKHNRGAIIGLAAGQRTYRDHPEISGETIAVFDEAMKRVMDEEMVSTIQGFSEARSTRSKKREPKNGREGLWGWLGVT